MTNPLVERVAIVTGSSRGIGRAIALCFSDAGADIVVNYRESREQAEKVVQEIQAKNRRSIALQADVSDFEQAESLVKKTLELFPGIDILVNNAGLNWDATIGKMTPEMWQKVLAVNLNGVFNMTRAVVNHMQDRAKGKIINISSVVGQVGITGTANYAAAKAGISGFTRAVAKELARKGITVNTLALGYFNTGIMVRLAPNVQENILRQIPMGRLGTEDEVAQSALFLASDASNYITGQTIHVNGGFYM